MFITSHRFSKLFYNPLSFPKDAYVHIMASKSGQLKARKGTTRQVKFN